MVQFNSRKQALVGQAGSLSVSDKDEVTRKLAMLIEGECEGLGPVQAAKKFGYTRQRYFQIRAVFLEDGATALADKPRGPKRNYRRTSEVVRQVIRYRFLDADASAQVIGQKLRQAGWVVSTRSVERVIADSVRLQVALGQLRRASGDYRGKVLAIDPHRVRSYSQRQMRMHAKKSSEKPIKTGQTFWLLDADTEQPVCFTTATSSRTVAQVTPQLLRMAGEIFGPEHELMLVADTEHQSAELLDRVAQQDGFEMLVPMADNQALRKQLKTIPAEAFTRRRAGFATMKREYQMKRGQGGLFYQYVQRSGERMNDWRYKAFLSTADGDEVEALTLEFPKRWHIEEFFNLNQALGWKRAGWPLPGLRPARPSAPKPRKSCRRRS